MYDSQYYQENKSEQKDSITSGALTTGIIITVIVGILLAIKCITSFQEANETSQLIPSTEIASA